METVYRVMDALLPFELFRYAFMKNALLALLLLTPLLALLGTMAVNQRMAFFSDALGHSALAGLGLGVLLELSNVTLILVLFGILWAVLITRINRTGSASSDTTISVFSSAGIALGLLILSGSGQYNKYNIYRKSSGEAEFKKVAEMEAGSTSYTDKDLKTGTTYSYRITAVASGL